MKYENIFFFCCFVCLVFFSISLFIPAVKAGSFCKQVSCKLAFSFLCLQQTSVQRMTEAT